MQRQDHRPSEGSPSFDDCLKLLKGERDEQRLAGLLFVTKLCDKDDHSSIRKVYDAIGGRFLDRLLRTGMGEGSANSNKSENHDAYLQLVVMVLAVFCRVSDIASSKYMLSKVPLILEIMSKGLGSYEECLEILFLVLTANEAALVTICESGGLRVLASNMNTLPEGSHSLELAMRLVQLIISMPLFNTVYIKYPSDLAVMVAALGKQLAELHSELKFEALHILSSIVSSMYSESLHHVLCSMKDESWPGWIRQGVVAILQNRVASTEKLHALILAEFTISIVGERWLIGPTTLGSLQEPVPPNRCLLLVLELSRVEIAVLLNELAYLKYEVSQHSSSIEDGFISKKRNLAVVFSLLEKIIKLISNIAEEEGDVFDENTFSKIIMGLNETMDVVLEYLKDAKEHGRSKGDELFASVRVLGCYLAETPIACKENVEELLGYMLSIEPEDESSPLHSVFFLLPMLCQITMNPYGCNIVASSGAYKAVVEYLIKLIDCGEQVGNLNSIFLACDTVMNFLLKREEIQVTFDDTCFIYLLKAMNWAGNTTDASILMMASSICALILDLTSESVLLERHDFNYSNLQSLSQLIAKSLAIWQPEKMVTDDAKLDAADLHQIITSGYSRWSNRFPHIRTAVERYKFVV